MFKGQGKYILNLSSLEDKDIIIDNTNKVITIISDFPEIDVNFDESETVVGETEKSWYTVGDIKLSAEEFEKIKADTKDKILDELESNDAYITSINNTSKTIEGILNKLSKEKYSVKIYFMK